MFWSCIRPRLNIALPSTHQHDISQIFEVACTENCISSIGEDSSTVKIPFLNEDSCGFFALYEGHRNGYVASRTASLSFDEFLRKAIASHGPASDLRSCFETAYAQTDKLIERAALDRGTSAIAFMIRKHENNLRLYFSNVGCSRAILCRGSSSILLSEEHAPKSDVESARLASSSAYGRTSIQIRQLLTCTRALGDHLFKDWMISTPYYMDCDLTADDSAIICISSNLADLVSDEEIVDLSQGHISTIAAS